jgi:hypothetical protein
VCLNFENASEFVTLTVFEKARDTKILRNTTGRRDSQSSIWYGRLPHGSAMRDCLIKMSKNTILEMS